MLETIIVDHGTLIDRKSAVERYFKLLEMAEEDSSLPEPALKVSQMIIGDRRFLVIGREAFNHSELLHDITIQGNFGISYEDFESAQKKGGAFISKKRHGIAVWGRSATLEGSVDEDVETLVLDYMEGNR